MSSVTETPTSWCDRCCTRHARDDDCPGELLASGPERYGFRVLVDSPVGPEVHGTLLAPCGTRWRARILTFPNTLWVTPRGRPIKFAGGTPGEAEDQAVAFIREHCRRRGSRIRTEVPTVHSGPLDREQEPRAAASAQVREAQRERRALRVRFGPRRADRAAETDDLSEAGLFVRTTSPLPVGTEVRLVLEVGGSEIALRGSVRWVRERDGDGRPAGMGIRLAGRHPRYLHFVRQQRQPETPADARPRSYGVEELGEDGG